MKKAIIKEPYSNTKNISKKTKKTLFYQIVTVITEPMMTVCCYFGYSENRLNQESNVKYIY